MVLQSTPELMPLAHSHKNVNLLLPKVIGTECAQIHINTVEGFMVIGEVL